MYNKTCFLQMKHVFMTAFLLFCLLLPVNTIPSQAAENTALALGLSSILYNDSNGLPTSEANAIAQTSNGFIWIGGYSGLTRYDGNNFYRFDASEGIASVMSLYVDTKDRLWIGTDDNGAALYDEGEFRFFGKAEGLRSLSVRTIAEDASGNIILATTQGMAYVDNNYELHTITDSRIDEKLIRRLRIDDNGAVYGNTLDGCFFMMENLELTAFYDGKELGIGEVSCICPDPSEKGKVYLGMRDPEIISGNMLDGMKDIKHFSTSPQKNINYLFLTPKNGIFVCADNGVGYFDAKGKYFEQKNFPMNSAVERMMMDFEGNYWFTSSRQGVMKLVNSLFADITNFSGLDKAVVNTTCIYKGDLYIGTDTGLQLLDRNLRPKKTALTKLLKDTRIRSIRKDSKGNLWLCTYSDYGLICYQGDDNYTYYNEERGLLSNRTRTLTELSDGTIAVSASGGVSLIQDGRIIASYNENDGLDSTEILAICEGEDGEIYFGSDGNGIYIINNDRVNRLGVDEGGLSSESIRKIIEDPEEDIYWIITSNSIAYMQDQKIHTLSNFPYPTNYDMYFDDNGRVWVLSSNGIYVVNKENLLANKELVYTFYDLRSGLPSIPTAHSRSYLDSDGTLYIAGSSGVSSININQSDNNEDQIKLTVPYLEIDDDLIYLKEGEDVTIPADCRRITIYGYALTYTLQNPQLTYYLEGFDKDITSVSRHELQPVRYTNLDSGKYTFHLSVVDIMSGKETQTISVNLVKAKAIYEYVWFWVLVFVMTALAIFLSFRAYTHNKMEKVMREEKNNKAFVKQMIEVFAKSIDQKDEYANGHSFRVAAYSKMIAERLGYSETEIDEIYTISLIHDIGKITIPDEVLNKPGKLTDEEFEIVKQHTINGYDILKEIEILPELALGAGYHHERIDGTGYPFGKAGNEIPKVAQIIAVADAFDAMNSPRPYRDKLKMEDIVAELNRTAGTQLNEEYVQVLLTLIEEGCFDEE